MGTKKDDNTSTTPAEEKDGVVLLSPAIKRGDDLIGAVTLREPKSGELRGLNLADILNMKVETLFVLLPRITSPVMHRSDLENMRPATLVDFGIEVNRFLGN